MKKLATNAICITGFILTCLFLLDEVHTQSSDNLAIVQVCILDSQVMDHMQLMKRIIRETVQERAARIKIEWKLIDYDYNRDGILALKEFDKSFEEAFQWMENGNKLDYLCLAAQVEVDRSAPGSGPVIRKVSGSLDALAGKLGDHFFISAGNGGTDNFFAHTAGVTVVGADRVQEDLNDPNQYRSSAKRILYSNPFDKKTGSYGTSQSTARALGNEIVKDMLGK